MNLKSRETLPTIFALSLAIAVALGGRAEAVVALVLENPGSTTFQQTQNSPCVIGDPSCHNPAGFSSTTLPAGNQAQYDAFSPTYTVQLIRGIVGNLFSVGIDVNSTTSPVATERLALFELSINGVVRFSYNPASPTPLLVVNNGNGNSDGLLTGFNIESFAAGSTAQFHAIVNAPTAGREEFFLVSASPTRVPEPATMALLGVAVAALGFARHRRN